MLWSNKRILNLYRHLTKRKLQVLKLFDIYLTIVLALIILIGMFAPISEVTTAPTGTDKIIHIVAFAALVFPLALTKRVGLFPLFIFGGIFGASIEVLQPTFQRFFDVTDLICNQIGVSLGAYFGSLLRTRFNELRRQR